MKNKFFFAILILLSTFINMATGQDVTGTWSTPNGQKSEWIQNGQNVNFIYNGNNFKHHFTGRFISSNRITGMMFRINLDNNCMTVLEVYIDILSNESMKSTWVATDGNCDLRPGQTGSDVITKINRPATSPMNTFGGASYNPDTDITGSWGENDGCGDWFEYSSMVMYIYNNAGFKHYFSGGRSGNTISGTLHRTNRNNGCRTDLQQEFIISDANTMSYTWTGSDSNCDIANGQMGRGTITRKTASNPILSGDFTYNPVSFATLYPNPNFEGNGTNISTVGRKTLSELGLTSLASIKVAWKYKAIISYNVTAKGGGTTNRQIEVVGDREALPGRITAIEIVAYTPLNGWVDMHTHPMSHLGWGGKVFHGAPDIGILVPAIPAGNGCRHYERATNINDALASCRATHGGYGLLDNQCGDELRKQLLRKTEQKLAEGTVQSKHHEEGAYGYPDFRFWPAYNDMTHQQMWIDWIKRAYDHGLRTMVSLAVNNASYAAGFSGPGDRNPDDVSSANVQITEMIKLVNRHNGQAGSVDDWMEIAYSAADLRRIVGANKLAIILGVEVDNIGNFNKNPTVDANTLTEVGKTAVVNEIERLYRQGVRYIFPIHVVDNKFGGTAVYEPNFNFSNYHQTGKFFDVVCADQSDNITKPFTNYEWILGLAGAKMGVDIARRPPDLPSCISGNGHKNRLGLTPMGEFAIKEMMKRGMLLDIDHMSDRSVTMTLDLAQRFNYPVNSGHNGIRAGGKATERDCKVSQYQSIARLGGMAGLGTDGATPESFRDGYTQLKSVMSHKGVAIGTDVNGFAKLPRPPGVIGITYDASFPMCRTGNRSWDYNQEGVAHYGLMPDFLKDIRGLDITGQQVIDHLNRSPEYFAQMWEKCERQKANVRN